MTSLLDAAVARIAHLPEEHQDELARVLLELAGQDPPPYVPTSEEDIDLDVSISEAERGEFATDDEIRAIWAKRGRCGSATPATRRASLTQS